MNIPTRLAETNTQRNLFLFLSAMGAILAVFNLLVRPFLPDNRHIVTDLLMGLGLILLVCGILGLVWKRLGYRLYGWVENQGRSFHISPIQFIALALALVFSITCTLAAGFELHLIHPFVSLVSWGLAIFLVIFAGWERKPAPFAPWFRVAIVVFCLSLTAFLLRGLNLTRYPSVLSGDEASMGISSVFFLTGYTNNIFKSGWYSFPTLYFFIQSFGIAILGQTTIGLRITAALVGTMTVAALFLIMRAMFNSRAALIGSILLAFSAYHIHFSRLGLNNIWDGLSWLLTLGVLWWAWNHERRAAYVLTGICLGFAQYFYTSARGLFIAVPLWLFIVALQDGSKFKKAIPNIFLMGVTTVVVVMPLAWFFINKPGEFQAPMLRVTIFGQWMIDTMQKTGKTSFQVLADQFIASLMGITITPTKHAWYKSGYPLLRPFTAGLFYLGAGLITFKWKDNRLWLILVWLGMIITTSALSTDAPAAQRFVAAAPVCYMVIGYGVDKVIQFLEQKLPKFKKAIASIILIFVLFVSFEDAGFYFYELFPHE